MKGILKNTLSLTVITVIMGVLLGVVHHVTAEPIARQEQLKKEEAYENVYPSAERYEVLELAAGEGEAMDEGLSGVRLDEAVLALDGAGETLGYVLTVTTPEGYGGDIQIAMGISMDRTLQGIYFLSIEETAGLGMRADTQEFKSQFQGKQVESFVVTKNGASQEGEIDALSGATITSSAVTGAVNAGLTAFDLLTGEGGTAE